MDSIEFKNQLRETLEAMDKRISVLEHLVNDVIIGSLESAANEYKDEEDYGTFRESYGERLDKISPSYKVLFGDDYDVSRSLYDDLKGMEGYGTEGFDSASVIEARIADLEARIADLKAQKEEIEDDENKEVEISVEEIPEEQLKEELAEAMLEGVV